MGTTKKIQTNSTTEFTLPDSYGDADQALTTNGAGALSWSTITAEAGGTGKNYISNSTGNTDTTGWGVYADTAGETPVDGTGGSATVTLTRNTTTPLSGAGDLLITKDAANRQGEGAGVDFTIDNADKGQKMLISFDYTTSANYADDDVGIFIYDVTNSSLTRVNGEGLKAVSGTGKHYAQFQAASDSTSYRLLFHVASTSASAYTINLDTVSAGPSKITHGAMITDWQDGGALDLSVPTGTAPVKPTSTSDYYDKIMWRRVGSNMEIKFAYIHGGASGATAGGADYLIKIPGDYSVDYSVLNQTVTGSYTHGIGKMLVGHGTLATTSAEDATAAQQDGNLVTYGDNHLRLTYEANVKTYAWGLGHYGLTESDLFIFGQATIPIAGWSANTQTSQDYSGRDVVCIAKGLSAGFSAANNTDTKITLWDDYTDTTNSFDGTYYTIPEAGYYDVAAQLGVAWDSDIDVNLMQIKLYVDTGSGDAVKIRNYQYMTNEGGSTINLNQTLKFNKGDKLSFWVYQSNSDGDTMSGIEGSYDDESFFSIAKRSSAQTVLNTSEAIVCTLQGLNSAFALTASDWYPITDWKTPVVDTANAWDGTNDYYVVPEDGYYDVTVGFIVDDEATPYGMLSCLASFTINDNLYSYAGDINNTSSSAATGLGHAMIAQNTAIAVHLQKGDIVKPEAYYNGGDTANQINTNDQYTHFQIAKRGAANTYINTDRTVACRVSKDDVQSIGNASTVPIRYDDITYDTHGAYHLTDDKYTVPVTGYYEIYAKMRYQDLDEQPGDNYQMYILVGGVNKSQISDEAGATNTTSRSLQIQDTLLLNKGDEVTIACYQATGGAEGTMAQATDMVFTIRKI